MMCWENILQDAAGDTDAALAGKISRLCRLTDADIHAIAPTKIDKEKLAQIVAIVKNHTQSNSQKAQAIQQIGSSLNILVDIAAKFI